MSREPAFFILLTCLAGCGSWLQRRTEVFVQCPHCGGLIEAEYSEQQSTCPAEDTPAEPLRSFESF